MLVLSDFQSAAWQVPRSCHLQPTSCLPLAVSHPHHHHYESLAPSFPLPSLPVVSSPLVALLPGALFLRLPPPKTIDSAAIANLAIAPEPAAQLRRLGLASSPVRLLVVNLPVVVLGPPSVFRTHHKSSLPL